MAAIAGGLGIGAGVGISSVALAPFNAANTFMGSAFFGYGMILGERYMYQADWPKIQARLENGEKIENIIQEYTGRFTAVVMKEAKIIFDTVTQEFIAIMKEAAGIKEPGGFTVTTETGTGETAPPPTDTGQHTHYVQGKGVQSHETAHIVTDTETGKVTTEPTNITSTPSDSEIILKSIGKIRNSFRYSVKKWSIWAARPNSIPKIYDKVGAQWYNSEKAALDYANLVWEPVNYNHKTVGVAIYYYLKT